MATPKRLAIIGAGPSGLISLKYAKERLPEWSITCFEKGHSFGGSWAVNHPDFVSTSTKATTQFACFQKYETGDGKREEFFLHNEYGYYLNDFVDHFALEKHIELGQEIQTLRKTEDGGWELSVLAHDSGTKSNEKFSQVLICSGLANKLKSIDGPTSFLNDYQEVDSVRGKKVVVLGGGESAVDIADRLAKEDRENEVYLSLRSGIRVSPRIHPIRGVPSDYLRNRLMLSMHENLRNAIGQGFVKFRIKFERLLQRLFPSRKKIDLSAKSVQEKKAYWNLKINRAAKGKLFNMFHNKSDDFLNAIAEGRIKVIGPAVNDSFTLFQDFDQLSEIELTPDLAINAIGFDSNLDLLSNKAFTLSDFYLGSVHKTDSSLYCVGFVRPIIGNIPTISELQARYVVGLISGQYQRPKDLERLVDQQQKDLEERYPSIRTNRVYPADMFPFCDHLAKKMEIYPKRKLGWKFSQWRNFWLAPASTAQYLNHMPLEKQEIYTPPLLNALLCLIKVYDWVYRLFKGSDRGE